MQIKTHAQKKKRKTDITVILFWLVLVMFVISLILIFVSAQKDKTTERELEYVETDRTQEQEYELLTVKANARVLVAETEGSEEESEISKYSEDEIFLMACCVEAEAGIEDLKGKRLVVDVILNRVDSSHFPSTIEDVIKQKNQFSTWANGRIKEMQEHVSDETMQAIKLELEGERLDNEILFFTAGYYNPYGTKAYKYGRHYFGKWKQAKK